SPRVVIKACPAEIVPDPFLRSTTGRPRMTHEYSCNFGRGLSSWHSPGDRMGAVLIASVPVATRPTFSRISLGGCPAASTTVGVCTSTMGTTTSRGGEQLELHVPAGGPETRLPDVVLDLLGGEHEVSAGGRDDV